MVQVARFAHSWVRGVGEKLAKNDHLLLWGGGSGTIYAKFIDFWVFFAVFCVLGVGVRTIFAKLFDFCMILCVFRCF